MLSNYLYTIIWVKDAMEYNFWNNKFTVYLYNLCQSHIFISCTGANKSLGRTGEQNFVTLF